MGATVVVRLVVPEGDSVVPAECRVAGPDGTVVRVPLVAERDRAGVLQGTFVAARDGSWRIDVDLPGASGEKVSRRIQARLPDRELERPRLDIYRLGDLRQCFYRCDVLLADSLDDRAHDDAQLSSLRVG